MLESMDMVKYTDSQGDRILTGPEGTELADWAEGGSCFQDSAADDAALSVARLKGHHQDIGLARKPLGRRFFFPCRSSCCMPAKRKGTLGFKSTKWSRWSWTRPAIF